jgi:hypothetical protein
MPCRCVRRARLDEAQMHGNGTRALGALGGQIGSRRRGRGGVHGHARVNRLQGIDPLDRGRPGSEVTVQEVDGGVLTGLGIPGGVSAMSWAAWGVLGQSLRRGAG